MPKQKKETKKEKAESTNFKKRIQAYTPAIITETIQRYAPDIMTQFLLESPNKNENKQNTDDASSCDLSVAPLVEDLVEKEDHNFYTEIINSTDETSTEKSVEDDSSQSSEISISKLKTPDEIAAIKDSIVYWGDEKYEDGSYYKGGILLKNKLREGSGAFNHNTVLYHGAWKNGAREGLGCYKNTDANAVITHQYGHWTKDKFVQGNVNLKLTLSASMESLIQSITYHGDYKNSQRHDDAAKLVVLTHDNIEYKIIAEWSNDKITRIYRDDIQKSEEDLIENLLSSLDSAPNATSEATLFHLSNYFSDNDDNIEMHDLLQAMSNQQNTIFCDIFKKIIDVQMILKEILIFFNTKREVNDVLLKLKDKIKDVQFQYKRKLLQAIRSPAYDFTNASEAIKTFLNQMSDSLFAEDSPILYKVKTEHIDFFVQLAYEIHTRSLKFNIEYRSNFINRFVQFFLRRLFDRYILSSKDKTYQWSELFVSEKISHKNLYMSLLNLSIDLLLNIQKIKTVNIIDGNESQIKLSYEKVANEPTCEVYHYYYSILVSYLEHFTPWQRYDNAMRPKQYILTWLPDDYKDYHRELNYDLESEENLSIQMLIHLSCFDLERIESSNSFHDVQKKMYKLDEKLIDLIKDVKNQYEFWRELFSAILRLKIIILAHQSVHNDEEHGLVKMLENIEGINDLGPLLNLINTYIRYYDEYANIQTLFKERKFEINDMVSLKEFDKVYHNFIKELFSNASRIHEHIDILSRLIDFLIQIKKLDYTWLITDAEKNKLNEQDWLSLDNVNNYFYKIKNNFKDMSQMRHYVFDFLIGAITLISQFKFSVTGTNKLQAYTLLINAFGELLGHFIICQKTLYDAAQCSLADFIDKMLEPLRRMTKNIKDMDMLEHKCQLIQRYFLFTQRLGQMTIEEALEAFQKRGTSIQESQVEALKKAYEVIDECYKSSLDTYILCKTPAERSRFIMGKLDNLNILIPQEKLSQWSHEQRKEYIPQMLAIVVLILSLIESGFLDNNDKVSLDYFLKPHCVQILGILKLLAIDTESDIQNHIAEILTGQGKSWALAMIAVLFALTGEEVVIACYSENLTSRDQKSMERFFKALNVFDKIKYKTLDWMITDIVTYENKNVTIYNLVENIIKNEHQLLKLKPVEFKDKILLIDEVDVLLNLYGRQERKAVIVPSVEIGELQKQIWKKIKNQIDITLGSLLVENIFERDDVLSRSRFLISHIERMLSDSKSCKPNNQFRLNPETKNIEYLNYDEKFVPNFYCEYFNCFQYLMKCDDASLDYGDPKNSRYGYLLITCGVFLYSELVKEYSKILGVSGSLFELSAKENEMLTDLNIIQRSYYPNFFVKSKLRFNGVDKFHFSMVDRDDWEKSIIQHTKVIVDKDRSILIFFENRDKLLSFYEKHAQSELANVYLLLPETTDVAREQIVNKLAGQPRQIVLSVRLYGRGEDFKSSAAVNQNGGMHALQTFLSIDPKEQKQICGRVARKSEPGSYSLLICYEDTKDIIGDRYKVEIKKSIDYESLDRIRKKAFEIKCENNLKICNDNKKYHAKTKELRDEVSSFFSTKQNAKKREEILQHINELSM